TQAELVQAQTNWEAGFIRRLQSVGGFGGRADRLNEYNVRFGNPDGFQTDLDRYLKATTVSVSRYAREYLALDRRGIFHIVPQGDLKAQGEEFARAEPGAGPEPSFTPPQIQRDKLSNGLDILVVEDHKLPLVQTNLVLKSGWAADPADRPGAAALTAALLDEGTTKRTAMEIAEGAKSLGANLGTGSFADESSVSLNVLKKNLDAGLDLMADIVLNPTFPKEELERQRQLYLGRIAQEEKEPVTVAVKTYYRALYGPNHPYGQPYTGSGTVESINAIQREDLVRFYETNYFPNNAAVVMVGDITLSEAKAKVDKVFGRWNPGTVAQSEVPTPPSISESQLVIIDKPGAPQSVIVAGNLAIPRSDPGFMAFTVMNNALGGQFTSRINMNLREDKGFTYGAGSFLPARRGVGPFICYAPVESPSTKESVQEIIKEFRDIIGPRPLTDDEVVQSKDNMIKSFPQDFQTYTGIAGQLNQIVRFNLSDDEWETYMDRVRAIDGAAATRAAQAHLHPDGLLIVVVGDSATIAPKLKELNLSSDIDTRW
ncbi:MAG TPA: pitrilysin family protein, partial [Acidobacteriota bacterium]|nr:pitrilysin family protein [Acidobacteriota bacterium]